MKQLLKTFILFSLLPATSYGFCFDFHPSNRFVLSVEVEKEDEKCTNFAYEEAQKLLDEKANEDRNDYNWIERRGSYKVELLCEDDVSITRFSAQYVNCTVW